MCNIHMRPPEEPLPLEGRYFPPPWWATIGVTLLGVAVLLVSGVFNG